MRFDILAQLVNRDYYFRREQLEEEKRKLDEEKREISRKRQQDKKGKESRKRSRSKSEETEKRYKDLRAFLRDVETTGMPEPEKAKR